MYDNFDANKTFYTDTNGLEMYKRIVNHYDNFVFNGDGKTTQNITNNFYPVDSAIAMRDVNKNRQITVMNDRSQAGSAELSKSTIELMQHRRLITDDDEGLNEPLNETTPDGFGIKVTAKYYVHIFDLLKGNTK
jgi:catechol 2,3-dioxygenase-like lactoylglutathione lyase family enzyme